MGHPWLIVVSRKKPNRQPVAEISRLSLELPKGLYEKARRMAEAEDRSASAVIRRLIAEAPEPTKRVA